MALYEKPIKYEDVYKKYDFSKSGFFKVFGEKNEKK